MNLYTHALPLIDVHPPFVDDFVKYDYQLWLNYI